MAKNTIPQAVLPTFVLDRLQNDQDMHQTLLFFSFRDPLFQYRILYTEWKGGFLY